MFPLLALLLGLNPSGGPAVPAAVSPPTSKELHDWSTGMATQVQVLDALIADYDAEISELDARRLKLVADKAKTVGVRNVIALYSQGAQNWSTVVKP